LPSEEISSRLPELVAEATKELYQSFQFFEPSLRLIEKDPPGTPYLPQPEHVSRGPHQDGGAVAKSHLLALREIEGVQVTALCDPVKERAEALAGPFGALAFADCGPVIERADAVWVCTPPSTRRELVVAVAQAGRSIVMDKPIATTQADAVAILEAVDRSGILAIVNFSQRFGWLGQRMKTLVDSGALGEVISFWSHSVLPDPSHESWRHDRRFACGFTIESLCHNIDQMRWLAGPITAVGGRVAQTLAELPAFDNTMAAPWRRWSLCRAGERACSTPVGLRHFAPGRPGSSGPGEVFSRKDGASASDPSTWRRNNCLSRRIHCHRSSPGHRTRTGAH
jgi:hypothetical protein